MSEMTVYSTPLGEITVMFDYEEKDDFMEIPESVEINSIFKNVAGEFDLKYEIEVDWLKPEILPKIEALMYEQRENTF